MHDQHKKFSEELAQEAMAAIEKIVDVKSFIAKTKEASDEDTGTFEVIASTADVDRHGEIVAQTGWNLDNFIKNPIILFGHDYWSLPIGVATDVKVEDDKLIIKGKFASAEANPFAQQVRKLYDEKIMRATSVGFINLKYEYDEENDQITLIENELLELSFVPVPANPYAISLRQAKELGLNTEMLAMKGIQMKQDAPEEVPGDTDKEEEPEVSKEEEKEEVKIEVKDVKEKVGAIMTSLQTKLTEAVTETSSVMQDLVDEDMDEEKAKKLLAKLEQVTSADPPEESGEEATGGDQGEPEKEVEKTLGGANFDDWKSSKHLLRDVYTSVGKALEAINKRQKSEAD